MIYWFDVSPAVSLISFWLTRPPDFCSNTGASFFLNSLLLLFSFLWLCLPSPVFLFSNLFRLLYLFFFYHPDFYALLFDILALWYLKWKQNYFDFYIFILFIVQFMFGLELKLWKLYMSNLWTDFMQTINLDHENYKLFQVAKQKNVHRFSNDLATSS